MGNPGPCPYGNMRPQGRMANLATRPYITGGDKLTILQRGRGIYQGFALTLVQIIQIAPVGMHRRVFVPAIQPLGHSTRIKALAF